jgi:RIO-like serine/threonine protein kinase
MALGIYKSIVVDTGDGVDQQNVLLVPIELGRIISSLIHATNQTAEKSLKEIRCHVSNMTATLEETILVNKENDSSDVPKMLSMDRHLFVDQKLEPETNYSKQVMCW